MKKQHSIKEMYRQEHLLSMLIEEHERNSQFEQTVWILNCAHHFVSDKDFDYTKQHSLATYHKLYEQLYDHLLNQQTVKLV
ncbi:MULTISPECIES: hypothetical protein [Lysinibacillus]|uniref:hypothetical protein n=1 Tax=Lysinibacillus TaxID=400634 RepID=UPI0015E11940|nr:hypothetical protein [Lysinibacillus fusiformis]